MEEKWERPEAPPPPLFVNQPERDFVKQIGDELNERITGQEILYYPIDFDRTNFDTLYGESINKTFLAPIQIYALIAWEGYTTETGISGIDRMPAIVVHFFSRRLREDKEFEVREGDFLHYNKSFYEIQSLNEPRLVFGQEEKPIEIEAKCIKARWGTFNAE